MAKIKPKIMREISQKMHKVHKLVEKKLAYIFNPFLICKNITKQSKMHQETHGNFWNFLQEN